MRIILDLCWILCWKFLFSLFKLVLTTYAMLIVDNSLCLNLLKVLKNQNLSHFLVSDCSIKTSLGLIPVFLKKTRDQKNHKNIIF